jgi:hypothetical protein
LICTWVKELKNFAESNDKEYISIERRGDNLAVEAAATNNLNYHHAFQLIYIPYHLIQQNFLIP